MFQVEPPSAGFELIRDGICMTGRKARIVSVCELSGPRQSLKQCGREIGIKRAHCDMPVFVFFEANAIG